MKNCTKCNEPLHFNVKHIVCMSCRGVCDCGRPKDYRADHCKQCDSERSRQSAKAQWQRMRGTMLEQVGKACVRRRRKFEDITFETFRDKKTEDGRRHCRYWDENGKYRAIYRYQWVWIQHHGPIPDGYQIHHKDHDPTNDDIANLEMLTEKEHHELHGAEMRERGAKWKCQHCGIIFYKSPRGETRIRKYCSQKCHFDHKRGVPIGTLKDILAERIQ